MRKFILLTGEKRTYRDCGTGTNKTLEGTQGPSSRDSWGWILLLLRQCLFLGAFCRGASGAFSGWSRLRRGERTCFLSQRKNLPKFRQKMVWVLGGVALPRGSSFSSFSSEIKEVSDAFVLWLPVAWAVIC